MTHQQLLEQFVGYESARKFVGQLENWRGACEPTVDDMRMFSSPVVAALGKYREAWQSPGFSLDRCPDWLIPIATGAEACVSWIERDCTGVGVPEVALAVSGLGELRSRVIFGVAVALGGRPVFRPCDSKAIAKSTQEYAATRIPEQNERVLKHYELLLRISEVVAPKMQ